MTSLNQIWWKNIYLLQSLFSANKHENTFKNHACISNKNEKEKKNTPTT